MSDKHYVGRDLVSFANNGTYKPVSRVTLMIDDENCITAGDDTGTELVATCYHATQAMADALLAKFKGYEYSAFEARSANLDPAAELGDGITADGHYSVISRLSDDGNGYPSPSAPGKAELEDEYPSGGPMTQEFNRKIAQTNSRITKTAEQIRLEVSESLTGLSSSIEVELDSVKQEIVGLENAHSEMELSLDGLTTRIQDAEGNIADLELTTQGFEVSIEDLEDGYADLLLTTQEFKASIEGLEGDYAELALTLDGLTVTDGTGTTRIKGSSIETDSLYVNAANITGTLAADQIRLSGSITWNDLSSGVQSTINGAYTSGLDEDDVTTLITSTLVSSPTIMGGAYYDNSSVGKLTLSYANQAWLTFETTGAGRELFSVTGTDHGSRTDVAFLIFSGKTVLQHLASTDVISLHNVNIESPLSSALESTTIIAKLKSVLGLS